MSAPFDDAAFASTEDDEPMLRELFALRAEALEVTAQPLLSVDDAIARGEKLRAQTCRVKTFHAVTRHGSVIASLTVAAATLLFVVGSLRVEHARTLAQPAITSDAISSDRESSQILACGASNMSSLLTAVCEAPASGALAARGDAREAHETAPASDSSECAMSFDDLASESSSCAEPSTGRDVTCSLVRP